MHPFEQKLLDTWACQDWGELTILLAVSGGGDSVALLRAICAIRKSVMPDAPGQVAVAHFNHRLRGEASDRDERFVVSLCDKLGVPCLVGTLSPGSDLMAEGNQGQGIESLARHARYAFLEEAAARLGARYLVTAHTFDDQVETILHRILRGTGLKGLGGIARARRLNDSLTLLRPMLDLRREEVHAYLADLDQSFCQDASNSDRNFTRNRLRHELLPTLQREYNPAVDDALVRLGQLAQENQAVLEGLLDRLEETCVEATQPDSVRLNRTALLDVSPYLIRELMVRLWTAHHWPQQAMGYEQWTRLTSLIQADQVDQATPTSNAPLFSQKITLPGNLQVEITERTVSFRL